MPEAQSQTVRRSEPAIGRASCRSRVPVASVYRSRYSLPVDPAAAVPRPAAHRREDRPRGGLVARCYVITGVLLLVGVLFRIGLDVDEPVAPELRVSIKACLSSAPPLGGAEVLYTVTNGGRTFRSATLHVEYRDGAGRMIGAAEVPTGEIGPGTSIVSGKSTPLLRPPPVIRCTVSIVR